MLLSGCSLHWLQLVPAALQSAITEDLELRRGLPTDYLQYMGIVSSDVDDQRRKWFCDKVTSLVSKVATDNISSFLPPCLTSSEKSSGVWSQGSRWKGGAITDGPKLTANIRVKLLRYGILRMVVDEEGPMILENTRIYQEKEMAGLAIREADAPAIEQLLTSYPDPIAIDSLAVEESLIEDKETFESRFEAANVILVPGDRCQAERYYCQLVVSVPDPTDAAADGSHHRLLR
ncbi:hypothetical protein EMCRGX_G032738 [Ephydatia muelleri]|eukprot:Em0019g1191a